MKTRILAPSALATVSPAALAAYVRGEGWMKTEPYGQHGDIYKADDRPELILPRTDRLVDYVSVVSRLLGILSEVNGQDEIAIYRDLTGADHDVVRVRAIVSEEDGTVPINQGVEMVAQAKEMLLSAACATRSAQAVYRAGANREAADYMKQVRLGQTEHGSFVVTMMGPVPPLLQSVPYPSWVDYDDEPYERQVTRRLVEALEASRDAAEKAHSGDGAAAFESAVDAGVSANLCDAMAKLIEGTNGLEVSVSWARTRPTPDLRRRIRFSESDAGAFKEAARLFLAREPRLDTRLFGTVNKLTRGEHEIAGQATFRMDIDGKNQSVSAILDQRSYSVAIHAHGARNPVIVTGDLERVKQRWHMANATVREFVTDDDAE